MQVPSLLRGDCRELLHSLGEATFDTAFADSPYFLSGEGSTCRGGERAPVRKGSWDESKGRVADQAFHEAWLEGVRHVLAPDGVLWASATHHSLFDIGSATKRLGFRVLNVLVWAKPNPPPNLGRRCFTHSTEHLIWASRSAKSRHAFDYEGMRRMNGQRQMKDVWDDITAPGKAEVRHGRHPTQKPLALLYRILLASCRADSRVIDPFNGSGTTGIVARWLGLDYAGIDKEEEYLDLTRRRFEALRPAQSDDDAGDYEVLERLRSQAGKRRPKKKRKKKRP